MVDDKDIKTKESPFSMRSNEIKVFDGKDGYVSMSQIVFKVNMGHISETHFSILEIINDFEFATSRQIYQMLLYKEIDVKSQDKLNYKLEQLIKSKIITRYYFESTEGSGIYRTYCLDKAGKYLLNSRGITCNWQPTDNTKPVYMIKKRLAGNQILLAYLTKVSATFSYETKPSLSAKVRNTKFKPSGGRITLEKGGKKVDFLFEVVRRNEDWEKKLIDKMKLYKDFYETFNPKDYDFERLPQLIIVGEDDPHTGEIFKAIKIDDIELKGINIYYTADLKQLEDSLDKSLSEFYLDEESKKYKNRSLEIKLLA